MFLDSGESAQCGWHVLDGALAILTFTFFLFLIRLSISLSLPFAVFDVDPFLYLFYLIVDLLLTNITALW